MSKLERLTGKVFGVNATATGTDPEIGQFGSAAAGTYVGTTDVSEIQELSAWDTGWIDAVAPNQQFPALPEMTGVMKVFSHQYCYILQQGLPEYDSGTTYYIGSWVKALNEDEVYKIYESITDNNVGNDVTDTANWKEVVLGENIENLADTSLSNLVQKGEDKLNYNVFCVNTGDTTDEGEPAFLSVVSSTDDDEVTTSTLTTSGEFAATTAAGVSYTVSDTLTLDITDYEDGTYNVYINPVTLELSAIDNTLTYGITFPDDAADGDYLLNTAKVPYDLQQINITTDEDTEETTTTVTTDLNEVYAGTLVIE